METEQKQKLMEQLKARFIQHEYRHPGLDWQQFEDQLNEEDLEAALWMEQTGGEPDAVAIDGDLSLADFSKETPKGRVKCCYDRTARESRKKNPPETSAMEEAEKHHVKLLDEEQYAFLQKIEPFDEKTSSWIFTPESVRSRGGALFGDHRYGRTFTYHNGAASWYSSRGFRTYRIIGS